MKKKPKLGQNFLVDDSARQRIAGALGDISTRTVIEIGPGKGAITDLLTPRARRLIAIELDRELAPALAARYVGQAHVSVIEIDILDANLAALIPPGETADVIGNLPYYITSDILLKLFAAHRHLRSAVVMMQKEVADRVAASPGTRDFGLLSATAQMHAQVTRLFDLPPRAFSPPPKVDSTVLLLDFAPRFDELQVDAPGFDRFLKQAFAQKRKTLNNNLRAANYTAEQLAAWPDSISRDARAEALSLEQLAEMYRVLR